MMAGKRYDRKKKRMMAYIYIERRTLCLSAALKDAF